MIKKLILLVLSALLVCAQNSSVCDVVTSIAIIASQAQAVQLEGHEDFDELKDVVTIDPFLASSSISIHKSIYANNAIVAAVTFLPTIFLESLAPSSVRCSAFESMPLKENRLWLLHRSLLI